MAEQNSPNTNRPIAASADKFAKEEAQRGTTVGFEGHLPQGGAPADATVTVTTSGATEKFGWSIGAWFKRAFTRKGNSAGVKGEIKF